jgi:hypothetical protein
MASIAILQQQGAARFQTVLRSDCWEWWSAATIARITNTPQLAVISDWPLIWAAMEHYGIADYNTARGILATIAIETAHTFMPVREAFWLDAQYGYEWAEEYRRTTLPSSRYWPYYGRGYIQLTWQSNYEYYGWRVGNTELVNIPDAAMESSTAAKLLATFFLESGAHSAAVTEDWWECRRLVQGGSAGIAEFLTIVAELDAARINDPLALSEVLSAGYSRIGDPYVWDGEQPGGFDCSGYVSWCYNGMVTSYTDAVLDETTEAVLPATGDIVMYEYYDASQPNTRFPHMGLWLNARETLDARGGVGVGVHPHLQGVTQWLRRVPGVVVDTAHRLNVA